MKRAMIDIRTANSLKRYIEGDRSSDPNLVFLCPSVSNKSRRIKVAKVSRGHISNISLAILSTVPQIKIDN
jgi:hypothetical protein